MLRWGALAATLTVVVVVGMKVSRDDLAVEAPAPQDFFQGDEIDIIEELETPEEEAAAPPAAVSTPARETAPGALLRRQESEDIRSNESEPEMLRQRIARAPARTKIEAADALGSGSRAEPKATSETSGVESPARIELAEAANVEPMRSLVLGEMQGDPAELAYPKLRPGNAGRRGFTATVEDCDTWRAYLESYPDGSRASDARYELARCTLGRYEAEPSARGPRARTSRHGRVPGGRARRPESRRDARTCRSAAPALAEREPVDGARAREHYTAIAIEGESDERR